jgi:glutaminyl-tRNA synthetase
MLAMRENLDFLREIVQRDSRAGAYGGRVATRFPPEPNGFLHIGHAKSICINFGIAAEFGGACHLRFDDTNPETEDMKYVESIRRDVRWLGFDWKEKLFFASDYYERLYELAVRLIRDGKAYVDSRSDEEIRKGRGTITEPGVHGPYRDRAVEENLDLFARMKAGEFPDGAHVLRAKIDMAARNMKMRDPLLYRIRHATHYRRATPVSTRCTISPTRSPTRSRGSRTPSARLSSRTTGRSMTGSSTTSFRNPVRASTNSHG